MRVLLADDDALVRQGFAALLGARGIEVVGEASDGREAVEKARQSKPTVVLMDVQMPGNDGLWAMRVIKEEMPEIKVAMLSVCGDDAVLFEAIRSGADGYILKNVNAEEFFQLLATLERGEKAVTSSLSSRIIREIARGSSWSAPAIVAGEQLTAREVEVLNIVAEGESNKAVANRLHLSENTVKFHLKNVMGKLRLRNRTQLAAFAINKGRAFAPAPLDRQSLTSYYPNG